MLFRSQLVTFLFASTLLASSLSAADQPANLHLPFWDAEDVRDVVGPIAFKAELLQKEGLTEGWPAMLFGCEVPREDGSAWVYGWKLSNWQKRETRTVEIIRVSTRDGRNFTDEETVATLVNPDWQGFVNILHRPTDGHLFLFSWSAGHLYVYESTDGKDWKNLTQDAYAGHDAMNIIFYPPFNEFVNFQNSLKKTDKRYPDNINEYSRYIAFRRSSDGVKWEDFSPPFLNGEKFWTNDAQDPVDLEFYRSVVFPTQGRYAMLLQNYYPPPQEANSRRKTTKHGPRSEVEWAISRDGLNWSRPFRDIDATELVGALAVQGPLTREGMLRFYERDRVITSIPEGRIFYATGRGNAEFSTPVFKMPNGGLTLEADVRYKPYEGETGRAYLMAELRNADGVILPGYERQNCLLENVDARALKLKWGDKTGSEFGGEEVRLRFYFRDAKIYSLSGVE